MANRIGGGCPVIKVDSAGTIAGREVYTRLKGVSWVGATTAGHQLVLSDINGCTCWESVATGANFVDRDAPSFTVNGLVVVTISSGTAYLELG